MRKKARNIRVFPDGLRAKAAEYLAADQIDVEELAAILVATAHLLDSIYAENDATSTRRSAQAAKAGAIRQEKTRPRRDKARAIFDRWMDPKDRLKFKSNADFGRYVILHSDTKFRSVEHWAKRASSWKREHEK